MKIYRINLLLLLLLTATITIAQDVNRLYVPHVKGIKGTTINLPVCLDNTRSDIVGMQWDITTPEGITLKTESVVLNADRKADHAVTAEDHGDGRYTIIVFSPSNQAIRANSGEVVTIRATLSETLEEEATYPITLTRVVLSDPQGINVATTPTDGSITITHTPDFAISGLQSLTTAVEPGGVLRAQWTVSNVGEVSSAGGWSERISLVMTSGHEVPIATLRPEESSLAAGQQVTREAAITLSELPGADGSCALKVEVVPDADAGESTTLLDNNTAITPYNAVTVGKKLSFTLPAQLTEGNDDQVRCLLSRSGSRNKAETFLLQVEGDDRVTIPTSVTISEGASGGYFMLDLADNDQVDEDSIFTLSASGNGYEVITTQLTVIDNDLPPILLTASKTDLAEGETFDLTITLSRAASTPVTIALNDDVPGRLSYAKEVTIQPGSTTATIKVQVTDNQVIDQLQTAAIYARATGFAQGECLVMLTDNDMPTLTFTLTPSTVSESAGAQAVIGVIRRTDQLDKKVTLMLSDNSNGMLHYPSTTLVMKEGEAEVQFSIGIYDNSTVEGDRPYEVTATVYATSCNCPAEGNGHGQLTQTITVTDDDGPALALTADTKVLLEGADVALVISRNTSGNNATPLTVTLSSDQEDRLTYNHQVAFAAGENSKTVTITAKRNNAANDDAVVAFLAQAEGYAEGSLWMLITDQNQPDVALGELKADNLTPEVGSVVNLTLEVKNTGNTALPGNLPITLRLDGKQVSTLTTPSSIAAGGNIQLHHQLTVPTKTGDHVVQAEANENREVRELLYVNNLSEALILHVQSNFIVNVKADKERYDQRQPVTITGSTTGSAGANADVEIYLINNGTRQILKAHTDNQGKFSLIWTPLTNQCGHFILGGCYPGDDSNEAMDEFDVVGLYSTSFQSTWKAGKTETYEGTIRLYNEGVLPQSNITVKMDSEATSGTFHFQPLATLGAGEWGELHYTFEAQELTPNNEWEKMSLTIQSAEGASYPYNIYYYVQPLRGSLISETEEINTTVTIGTTKEYPIIIQNVGKGETGTITLSLPDWITETTPVEMGSLPSGRSARIILNINTTEEMQPNLPIKGHLGINCADGDGVAIPFTVTPVSDKKGTLTVDVVDEFTFNTTEAPHVEGAQVKVMKPATGELVVEGTTGADGHFTVEIEEGWYELQVNAYKHASNSGSVVVDPGRTKNQQVFISYQNVTYDWDVVETETDDEYQMELKADFETRVPKPYVTVEIPDERPTPYGIFPITIENKGIVNVKDVRLNYQLSDGCQLVWLNDPYFDILEPQVPKVLYAKVIPPAPEVSKVKKSFPSCLFMAVITHYRILCDAIEYGEYTETRKDFGDCNNLHNFLLTLIEDDPDKDKEDDPDIPPSGPPMPPVEDPDEEEEITLPPGPPIKSIFCDLFRSKEGTYNANSTTFKAPSANLAEEEDEGICSTITLSLNQTAVLTRQAFLGTLTINNGHETDALQNLKIYLQVKDSEGNVATSHEFQIDVTSLEGFQGEKALDAGWTLAGSASGTATIQFIPTPYAAPDGPVTYDFGGSFSYTDPLNGLTVTHEMNPVSLTVNPTPRLDLTYFLQRDVISDDPLTSDVVEKAELAEFALLINNKGNGDAKNLRLTTEQPQIVENEKGLLIDFELISSQLNGKEASLALGGSAYTSLGTIPAHEQAYAQWWLKSSLLGHFTKYDIQANHISSHGNPDLSLLDAVSIHELIRSVMVPGTDHRAFIVNDIKDANDQPDMVYLTDGTVEELQPTTTISVNRQSNDVYTLVVGAPEAGWVYGNIPDPTGGKKQLTGIIRNSDGQEMSLRNIWQTYVTLRDGKSPLHENRLHIADLLEGTAESYTLTFEPKADLELDIVSISGQPENGETIGNVQGVTVVLNKEVIPASFTNEDVTLTFEGKRLDNSQIDVNPIDGTSFMLNLYKLTTGYGYYVLTVSTKDIFDAQGFKGSSSTSVSWLQNDPTAIRDLQSSNWTLRVEGDKIIIQSATDMALPVHTADGRLCRILQIPKGISVHQGFSAGIYIVRNHKVVIGR
jgi:hypothetical protein